MNIGDKQIQLIDYVKFFLKSFESSSIKPFLSSLCYFLTYDETPGYAKLKFQREGWFFLLVIKVKYYYESPVIIVRTYFRNTWDDYFIFTAPNHAMIEAKLISVPKPLFEING